MSDRDTHNFHTFSFNSALFKGQPDLYFCHLKSEKLAQALPYIRTALHVGPPDVLEALSRAAVFFPTAIARFAAGELEEAGVLADLFEILSLLKIGVGLGLLNEKNASILIEEYKAVGVKIDMGKHASPFLILEDIQLPPLGNGSSAGRPSSGRSSSAPGAAVHLKDNYKGQNMSDRMAGESPLNKRTDEILALVRKQGKVSIKDLKAVIKDCSAKTVQRELLALVRMGLVRKEGNRRWSVCIAV